MDVPPNKTLYVKNVTDKVKKEPLKRQLYMAFGAHGKVIDIIVMKGADLRGQAWVVYDDILCATNALRNLQGFPFFGKPLRIAFAKSKSEAVAIKEGTYEPKLKRQKRKEAEKEGAAGAVGRTRSTTANGPASLVSQIIEAFISRMPSSSV